MGSIQVALLGTSPFPSSRPPPELYMAAEHSEADTTNDSRLRWDSEVESQQQRFQRSVSSHRSGRGGVRDEIVIDGEILALDEAGRARLEHWNAIY